MQYSLLDCNERVLDISESTCSIICWTIVNVYLTFQNRHAILTAGLHTWRHATPFGHCHRLHSEYKMAEPLPSAGHENDVA